ncbi:MAG: putative transport system ATP-binding protein [Actinomycetota bacterium]|nr:putative transport system ATP-binding protein [Actinomycetota bacterium]MDQ1495059.1 putative transport system ATP-binding protein [Actinomycetota bacterium]
MKPDRLTGVEVAGAPGVELRGIVRRYAGANGDVVALDGVDAAFPAGTFTVVAGPSGSGKTTLLRLVALLDRPERGHVLLGGVDVTIVSPRERRLLRRRYVGYMFQQPGDNLLEYLSADEHVRLGYRLRAAHPTTNADLLDVLGLADRVTHRPAHLSGGEQQRLAFAFAAAGAPRLLVADEPTAALDHAAGARVVDALRALADRGVTVVASSHDPAVVAAAGSVIRIAHGRIADEPEPSAGEPEPSADESEPS